jgi:hypothetical protein
VYVDVDGAVAVAADIAEAGAADIVAAADFDAHCWMGPCYFPSCRQHQRIHEPSGTDSYSDDHPRLDENLAWKDWVVVAAVVGVPLVVGLLVQAEAAGDTIAGETVVEPVAVAEPEPVLAHSDDCDSSSDRQYGTELYFAAAAGLEVFPV